MTFDDDYIRLILTTGPLDVTCKALGLDWPPPEFITITGGPFSEPTFRRVRYSLIIDEERAEMAHVCRGAEYRHATRKELRDLAKGF